MADPDGQGQGEAPPTTTYLDHTAQGGGGGDDDDGNDGHDDVVGTQELARGIKDGTVELYRNVKHTRRLRAVVRERGIDALTRREIRLMNRTREDLKALVPFLILEIVCA